METDAPSLPISYKVVGTLYTVAGLPGFLALVGGKLSRGGNPYFALSFMGVPLGLLFLAYGFGKLRQTKWSDIAMRVGAAGLLNLFFMMGSRTVMQHWHPGFGTAYHFFAVVVAFLGTISLGLCLFAWRKKER